MFFLHVFGAMGAGDVKLMAAVGSLVGWQNRIGILIATALVGGVAALGIAASRRRIGKTLWNLCFIVSQVGRLRPAYLGNEELDVRSGRSVGLPHGALIAAGTVIFLGLGTYYTR
jgi:prepilin peptidase CpaA